jgi:hypothetical protein
MRRKRTTNQLLATAYHEAGHAAAAHYLEIPLADAGATIVAGDGFDGRVTMLPEFLLSLGQLDCEELTDAKRLIAERDAIMALAGMEAQRKYRPSSVRHYHASQDYRHAVDVISYFAPEEAELNAYLRLLGVRACNLIASPQVWEGIEALASALMARNTQHAFRRRGSLRII